MIPQILAIAGLTLREAIRRRTFALVLIFAVLLICSAAFFPTIRPGDAQRLMHRWSVLSTALFGAVMGIVVAGMSLPTEFAKRRIFNLSSKPVPKAAIFLGRFVGFAAALGIYVAMTAALSIAYIRTVGLLRSDLPPLKADPHAAARAWGGEGTYARMDLYQERWIVRGEDGRLIWEFGVPRSERFDDPVPAQLNIEIHAEFEYSGDVRVRVEQQQADGWRTVWPGPTSPAEGTLFVSTSVAKRFGLPRAALEGGRPVRLVVSPATRKHTLYARQDSLQLVQKSASFDLNMIKGFSLIYLGTLILMSVSLAASVWLSGPVAMVVGLSVAFFGVLYGTFVEGVRTTRSTIKTEEQRSRERERGHGHDQPIPLWALKFSAEVTQRTLTVVPNFDRIDPTPFLANGVDVPLDVLADRWLGFLPFVAIPLLVGLVLMQLKEFSS
jgi:ABC-type transport system involved in multi-copper enzyme maturation permease subunit